MISNATPHGDGANAAAPSFARVEQQDELVAPAGRVELTSAESWYDLIREVVTIANQGGGRVDVHCVPNNDSAGSGRVFSAPIKSAERAHQQEFVPQPVRIVTDPDAPALQPQDVDHLYPWRQKDLLRELNNRLGRRVLNSYDIQAVRRQHHLDDRPDFVFNLPGAGRRYSPAVAEWVMDQFGRDPEFFHQARAADHEIMRLRRQKPK